MAKTPEKTIAFATDAERPQGGDDDRLLRARLKELGITVETPIWDDPQVDWKKYQMVLPRSVWDYTSKYASFIAWLTKGKKAGVVFQNPADLLIWNSNKVYLRELESEGLATLQTRWETPRTRANLEKILSSLDPDHEWILKPSVSSGSDLTLRFDPKNTPAKAREEWIQGWVNLKIADPQCVLMIQKFETAILDIGETSLLMFDGKLEYAVQKRAKDQDFRTQPNFGAKLLRVQPTADQIATAQTAMTAVRTRNLDQSPLYARIDLVGSKCIEVELIEPNFFFQWSESKTAHEALAQAIVTRLAHR